jgi:hypothetical protein
MVEPREEFQRRIQYSKEFGWNTRTPKLWRKRTKIKNIAVKTVCI